MLTDRVPLWGWHNLKVSGSFILTSGPGVSPQTPPFWTSTKHQQQHYPPHWCVAVKCQMCVSSLTWPGNILQPSWTYLICSSSTPQMSCHIVIVSFGHINVIPRWPGPWSLHTTPSNWYLWTCPWSPLLEMFPGTRDLESSNSRSDCWYQWKFTVYDGKPLSVIQEAHSIPGG